MRTVVVLFVAGLSMVAADGAWAQSGGAKCAAGQILQRGVCVDRPRAGPGAGAGSGETYGPGLPGYEGGCVNVEYDYINCGGMNTGRIPNVRRPPGH